MSIRQVPQTNHLFQVRKTSSLSPQGSGSNSRRTSGREAESDASPTTAADFLQQLLASAAESRANVGATPVEARANGSEAEEGGEGPSPVLRAIARR